jgi:4-hydroxybenzoate polyprenyltransferase/phosphoserine phosphatase
MAGTTIQTPSSGRIMQRAQRMTSLLDESNPAGLVAKPDIEERDANQVPLCIDLDGTLIQTDLLVEGVIAVLTNRRLIGKWPRMLATSRAGLKHNVAALAPLDVSLLPYNRPLLSYLREQKVAGRKLVLATAADQCVAHAVADHLDLFDEVIASDGEHNLKGEAKAQALVQRFGLQGFSYVGNESCDMPVWRAAYSAVVVNASRAVSEDVSRNVTVEAHFDGRPSRFRAALTAMRPHQWAKNVLVFIPLIMAHAVTDITAWCDALGAFVAFCATASGIYLVNDLADITADRQHPRKRRRPFASGALPLTLGTCLACALLAVGLGFSTMVGASAVIGLYAIASISYSLALKEFPLVDVFMLAGLYTIRVFGGGVATGHWASLWLLAFCGFLFLGLALIKRTEEMAAVARSGGDRVAARRGYFPGDVPILQSFGCASTFASGVVLALFVGSDAASAQYAAPGLLWGIVPLILFWECRLWLSTARGHMHDDPIVYATRDWVSWIVAACVFAVVTAASIGVPFSLFGIAP